MWLYDGNVCFGLHTKVVKFGYKKLLTLPLYHLINTENANPPYSGQIGIQIFILQSNFPLLHAKREYSAFAA